MKNRRNKLCMLFVAAFGVLLFVAAFGVLLFVAACGISPAELGDDCPVSTSEVCCVCFYDTACDSEIEAICCKEEKSVPVSIPGIGEVCPSNDAGADGHTPADPTEGTGGGNGGTGGKGDAAGNGGMGGTGGGGGSGGKGGGT